MEISRRTLCRRLGTSVALTLAPALAESVRAKDGVASVPASGAAASSRTIRLNGTESVYGPSKKAIAALREAVGSLGAEPAVESELIRRKLAKVHGVVPEQVVLGCGCSEILRMAADAFVGSGKKLIVAEPTFELIGQYARRRGAEVVSVPLTRDYAHDLQAMLARSDAATGLVYICNPNNPTGTLTSRDDLEVFLRKLPATAHVLIDEAYHDYVGESSEYVSFLARPVDNRRVIVARTFSKIYGLAGMRIGYAISALQTSRLLSSHHMSDDLNVAAAMAAAAALDDPEHVRTSMNRNIDDRQEFLNQANARMLRTIDSQTNFVMVKSGRPAGEIAEHFRKHDILIGPVFPAFDKYVRVSIGTTLQMNEFWRVWDLLPHHHMSM
jgi:histidinol-phosphate aminotransferase